MAKDQKVYMPLMIGDWLKGTRGMRAEVRGVYINLLLFQWDNGYIPSDMDELFLIDPEVGKVWDKLKDKFQPAGPGKLQNKKNEEVREFWKKQAKNGSNGGRPKKINPNNNPEVNPKHNPNTNHHIDIEYDNDLKNKKERDFSKPDIDGDTVVFPFDTEPMRKLWAAWKEVRWSNHQVSYAMHGEQADLKRFGTMSFQQIESTILAAIAGKWKNLYPEKNGNGTAKSKREQNSSDIRRSIADDILREHGGG